MSVLYSREFIKVLRQSKVCPRLTSLADCQVDSEKEWKRVRKRERARGENRTHLNFIFVCKFSIGFYAVRLVWKRKLSHRNRNREKKKQQKKKQKYASEWASLGLSLQSELLAICAHALPWLWHGMNWIRIWIACECGTPSSWFPSPLPLLPCHAFGYETIETSLQSVHKVFTRTQNTETAAETNRQTDERAEETDGQTGGRTDWDGQQTQQKIQNCEQIVRLLWLPPSIAAVRLPGRGVWL